MMKKILLLCAVFVLSLTSFLPAARPEETGEKHIVILMTADLQSQLEPYPFVIEIDGQKETRMIGGMARIAGMVNAVRLAFPENTVLVSSGDDLMGKYFRIFHGLETYTLMDKIGYDAVVLGNHEFDYGLALFAEAALGSKFPIVVSNMGFEGTSLSDRIKRYFVKEVDGVKIGFFGLMTPDVRQITKIEDPIKVDTDIFSVAREMVKHLREVEKVDLVVALTHIGVELDIELAKSVTGIDVICGGHSHTLLPAGGEIVIKSGNGEKAVIVQSGEKGGFLGMLDLTLKDGKVTGYKWSAIMLDETVESDPEVAAIVEDFKKKLPARIKLGVSRSDLDGRREVVRKEESNLGDLITDAMRARFGVDAAIINGGGIRGDTLYPKGEVYSETVLEFFPFENYVVKMKLTGKELREVLELAVSEYEKGHGKFLQVSGLKFTFDLSKEGTVVTKDSRGDVAGIEKPGKRVTEVLCLDKDGTYKPCQDEKEYTVAAGSYMAGGGDGYFMLKNKSGTNTFVTVQSVIEDYIKEKGEINPVTEGRITVIKPPDNEQQ